MSSTRFVWKTFDVIICGILVWWTSRRNQNQKPSYPGSIYFVKYEGEEQDINFVFNSYSGITEKICQNFKIEPAVILSMIFVESKGLANLSRYLSDKSDYVYGLMQIRLSTAREIGFAGVPSDLLSPQINILWGVRYFAYLKNRFDGFLNAIASYNAGSPRGREYGDYVNQSYVDSVVSRVNVFRNLYLRLDREYFKNNTIAEAIIYDTSSLV